MCFLELYLFILILQFVCMQKIDFSKYFIFLAFVQLLLLGWMGWRFKFTGRLLASAQQELQRTREDNQRLLSAAELTRLTSSNQVAFNNNKFLLDEFGALRCVDKVDQRYVTESFAYGWATKRSNTDWELNCGISNEFNTQRITTLNAQVSFACSIALNQHCGGMRQNTNTSLCKQISTKIGQFVSDSAMVTPLQLYVGTVSSEEVAQTRTAENVMNSPFMHQITVEQQHESSLFSVVFYSPQKTLVASDDMYSEPLSSHRRYTLEFTTYEPKTIEQIKPFVAKVLSNFTFLPAVPQSCGTYYGY